MLPMIMPAIGAGIELLQGLTGKKDKWKEFEGRRLRDAENSQMRQIDQNRNLATQSAANALAKRMSIRGSEDQIKQLAGTGSAQYANSMGGGDVNSSVIQGANIGKVASGAATQEGAALANTYTEKEAQDRAMAQQGTQDNMALAEITDKINIQKENDLFPNILDMVGKGARVGNELSDAFGGNNDVKFGTKPPEGNMVEADAGTKALALEQKPQTTPMPTASGVDYTQPMHYWQPQVPDQMTGQVENTGLTPEQYKPTIGLTPPLDNSIMNPDPTKIRQSNTMGLNFDANLFPNDPAGIRARLKKKTLNDIPGTIKY